LLVRAWFEVINDSPFKQGKNDLNRYAPNKDAFWDGMGKFMVILHITVYLI